MFQLLTPMNKVVRVDRTIDKDAFVAYPGYWAALQSDGSLANQTAGTPAAINKLVLESATLSKYESNDIETGRIATLEGPEMIRFSCGSEGYVTSANVTTGALLVVSVDAASIGKLVSDKDTVAAGTYEVVGKVVTNDGTTLVVETIIAGSTPITEAAPAAPTITATKLGSTSIRVAWVAVSGATSYKVYSSATSGGTYVAVAESPVTASPCDNLDLTADTDYFYKVKASNVHGDSAFSVYATAHTDP